MRGCDTCIHYDPRPGVTRFCLACPRMEARRQDCDAWIAAVPEAMSMRVLPRIREKKGGRDDGGDQLHS